MLIYTFTLCICDANIRSETFQAYLKFHILSLAYISVVLILFGQYIIILFIEMINFLWNTMEFVVSK